MLYIGLRFVISKGEVDTQYSLETDTSLSARKSACVTLEAGSGALSHAFPEIAVSRHQMFACDFFVELNSQPGLVGYNKNVILNEWLVGHGQVPSP